jgi:aryl-alcohol dehydrogenase-like predicted oxidoreductase
MSANCATPDGTRQYAERFGQLAAGHFREAAGRWWSSIGLGTYLGDADERTDAAYRDAIAYALRSGINVIDTAINYRAQRSEQTIGQVLVDQFAVGEARREELIICSKGGFVPYDMSAVDDPRRYIVDTYLKPGIARPEDFVGSHCMAPSYLEHELDQSLANLGLDCVDVYYVHNPETQLQGVPRGTFRDRLRAAFESLEAAVDAGKIERYGVATWSGFRQRPASADYLSLNEVVTLATEAGGPDHHFEVIQLPYNVGMPEAYTLDNQQVGSEMMSTLAAARALDLTVVASASLLQAQVLDKLPPVVVEAIGGLDTDAQRAIQFTRSTPGVTTALVGMSQRRHVEENLRTSAIAPLTAAAVADLFRPG